MNIKKLTSLKTKKGRLKEGLYLVEGERACNECPKDLCEETLVCEGCDFKGDTVLKKSDFNKISDTKSSQGIVCVAKVINKNVDKSANCVYLDNIQDPGNMGTILRSALAFGFKNIFCSKGCVDIYSPKVVRSAMGATFKLNIFQNTSIDQVFCKKIALTLDGKSVEAFNCGKDPICVVVGNEGNGICEEVLNNCDEKLTIPTKEVESLNAGVAGSIAFYLLSSKKD